MQISSLRVGEMGKLVSGGPEFLVTDRWPEDRSSGIQFVSGGRKWFIWDHEDPEVVRTGQGRIEIKKL
jgi:hypothetical protein